MGGIENTSACKSWVEVRCLLDQFVPKRRSTHDDRDDRDDSVSRAPSGCGGSQGASAKVWVVFSIRAVAVSGNQPAGAACCGTQLTRATRP